VISPPSGWSAIVATFSLPARDAAGNVLQSWKDANLTLITAPFPLHLAWGGTATKILCHKVVAHPLADVLENALELGYADYLSQDYGGCYVDRAIRGAAQHLSVHAFGAAIDFRVKEDPLGDRVPEPMMRDVIAPLFAKYGWLWGGLFEGRKDPEHFEWCSGY
jgi:D-alanyl-D-alanine carboxypeptidase-like protein